MVSRKGSRLYVCFSPHCFHKANVSGGENYHLWIPDPAADFRIFGDICPKDEAADDQTAGQYFVKVLRQSMQGGGFRGRVDYRTMRWQARRAIQIQNRLPEVRSQSVPRKLVLL